MKNIRSRIIAIIILTASFIVPIRASAQEAILKNITLRRADGALTVSFEVEGAFSNQVTEAVLRGVPADFSFLVSLNRSRKMWFDKEMANIEFTHHIKYDTLKKDFTITRPWKEEKPVITKSFAEAQKLMTEVSDLPLIPLHQLQKGDTYELWAKAELSKMTLPFYLHYIFYFVTLWDFETDWYTVDFTY
ncbi:MAG: DUF4390 domain-containing protein [Desulfobacterales bacterium]|jgi:hypothetical protein